MMNTYQYYVYILQIINYFIYVIIMLNMDRDLYAELVEWKESDNRKPLIIRGVRQCGKTYLMKQFGDENYPSVAYLKFEGNESLCRLFDGDLDPKRIITAISIHLDKDIALENFLVDNLAFAVLNFYLFFFRDNCVENLVGKVDGVGALAN